MALTYSRQRMFRARRLPPVLPPPGQIVDWLMTTVDDDEIQITFTPPPGATTIEYSLDAGDTWAVLPFSHILSGLIPATLYTSIGRAIGDTGLPGLASNPSSATTSDLPTTPGDITSLTALPTSPTVCHLLFTPGANSPKIQCRRNAGTPFLLNSQHDVTGLTPGSTNTYQVRGSNSAETVFGNWSPVAQATQPVAGAYDPLDNLTGPERAAVEAAGWSITPTRPWGIAGASSLPYAHLDPAYPINGSTIPATALDRSAYASNAAWMDACNAQGKAGKIKWTTLPYDVTGSPTILTAGKGIYGYNDQGGSAKPELAGDWKVYIQTNNTNWKGLKRSNGNLWLIFLDAAAPSSSSIAYNAFLGGAVAPYTYDGSITGFHVTDCEFSNFEHAICWHMEGIQVGVAPHRLSDVSVTRNTFLNGCKTIATGRVAFFGDGVNDANGIRIYGNYIKGGYFTNLGSWWATVISVTSAQGANGANKWPLVETERNPGAYWRNNQGPVYAECNHIEDMIQVILPRKDNNAATGVQFCESDTMFCRYNIGINVYSLHWPVDGQFCYFKGTAKVEENFMRNCGCGADTGRITQDGFDNGGNRIEEGAGGEGMVTMKGGGGYVSNRSTIRRNLVVPLFHDTQVFMCLHTGDIRDNIVVGWDSWGYSPGRMSVINHNSGSNVTCGPNGFINVGQADRAGMDAHIVRSFDGTPGLQINGLRVNFDGNRTDVLNMAEQIIDAENLLGQDLVNQTVFSPKVAYMSASDGRAAFPTITFNGSIFTGSAGQYNNGRANNKNNNVPVAMASVVRGWKRGGVLDKTGRVTGGTMIAGQTGSTLAASFFTDTIEYVETVTATNGMVMTFHSRPWHKYIGAELATAVSAVVGPWTGDISSMTHTAVGVASFEVQLGALVSGGSYIVRWIGTGVGASSGGSTTQGFNLNVIGGGRVDPLHLIPWPRNFWVKPFVALAGETKLRISVGSTYTGSVVGLSCGRIA